MSTYPLQKDIIKVGPEGDFSLDFLGFPYSAWLIRGPGSGEPRL
jgi:hypothetical protein